MNRNKLIELEYGLIPPEFPIPLEEVESRGANCAKEYQMINDAFIDLFDSCRNPELTVNAPMPTLDIVLHKSGSQKQRAIIMPSIPSFSQYAVSYRMANGFIVYYDRLSEGVSEGIVREDFSLCHRERRTEPMIYSAGNWNIDRVKSAEQWLEENLPTARETLGFLTECASDDTLNPKLAENIRRYRKEHCQLVLHKPEATIYQFPIRAALADLEEQLLVAQPTTL